MRVPLCSGYPLSSDFIYNRSVYPIKLSDMASNIFIACLNQAEFHVIKRVYAEAGEKIFKPDDNLNSTIPLDLREPSININSFRFNSEFGLYQKNLVSVLSLHSPFNCSFDSFVPLVYLFNCNQVSQNWNRFIFFLSRMPLFVQADNINFVSNVYRIMCNGGLVRNVHHCLQNMNPVDIQNGDQALANIGDLNIIRNLLFGYQDRGGVDRVFNDEEGLNLVFKSQYYDGRFLGNVSPQANNWYYDAVDYNKSQYDYLTFIKGLIDFTFMASAFCDNGYFTLNNAAAFVKVRHARDQSFVKFYFVYFRESPKLVQPNTLEIYKYIWNKVRTDQDLNNAITQTVGYNFAWNFDHANHPIQQLSRYVNESNPINDDPYLDFVGKNFYLGLNGLELDIRKSFALFCAGVLGHYYDYVLRYFDPQFVNDTIENQVATAKLTKNDFSFVKHIGSMLGSYFYDYRVSPERNVLIGYNINSLSNSITNGMVSLKDNVNPNNVYYSSNYPLGLFPICYQNFEFSVSVNCIRSFKRLLNYMNTRDKRKFLFDHLSQYGKRAFTVLDPYGIFMHFQNEQGGYKPA